MTFLNPVRPSQQLPRRHRRVVLASAVLGGQVGQRHGQVLAQEQLSAADALDLEI